MDDTQAIQRLKKGDIGGLEALIARYQGKALAAAYLITHDDGMAEDAVQETFLRIFHSIRHFDETRPFEPYFMRSVVHTALNAVKKAARELPYQPAADLLPLENLIQQAVRVEDQVEYLQLKQEIFTLLGKLPPRERAVIIQRYYLEMSEKEMAAEHSVAPGTVKWLLNTARKHLRALIGMEGGSK